jgi:DNA helicase II / ATP-dependent DNA helicase PcrA
MTTVAHQLSWGDFLRLVTDRAGLDKRIDQDDEQRSAVEAPVDESLQLVAGPGTGKTTTLTLRLLKVVFVDGVPPDAIVATTFTKKAAGELRSRILGWGDELRTAIGREGLVLEEELARIDLNQVTTGTLDSLAEEIMSEFRTADTDTLTPVEDFIGSAYMRTAGLFADGRYRRPEVRAYVSFMDGSPLVNLRRMVSLAREMRDRFLHDEIDVDAFNAGRANAQPGVPILIDAVRDYVATLDSRLLTDFAGIEGEFLRRLQTGGLARFTQKLRMVFVDEYQDTNRLQERIYFALVVSAIANGGSITIVGDDDQSLYRFRGATVDLFTNFARRATQQLGIDPRIIPLSQNYRSTDAIVNWASAFVDLDPVYSAIRAPGKLPLRRSRTRMVDGQASAPTDFSILGMFRESRQDLAVDIARFLDAVFNGDGFHLRDGRTIRAGEGGKPGDCALLCSSPRDYASGGNPRLPLLLRNELTGLATPIRMFNPRGEEFAAVPTIRILCGLILECLDPSSAVQQSIRAIPPAVIGVFDDWRAAARIHVSTDPTPSGARGPRSLDAFVTSWQRRAPQSGRGRWPRSLPVLQLLYQLLTWLADVQNDAEGLLYVEAVTRIIAAAATVGSYECNVFRDEPHAQRSITQLIRNVFEPIAAGEAEIDEDLMVTFPADRISVLSVHQAKGLEFPMVIVDVGSDFRTDHHSQRFRRFPTVEGKSQRMEDELWPFSTGLAAPTRPGLDRAFDDLIRQYFVAFTRPQDVLMLVGIGDDDTGTWVPRPIPNIATGWLRNRTWPWQQNPHMMLL